MKQFPLIIFLFSFFSIKAQVASKDIVRPKNLFSITVTEIYLRNFQINYECFNKKRNSLEVSFAWKIPTPKKRHETLYDLGFTPRYAFEYFVANGFSIHTNYKINLKSTANSRDYWSVGPYYRYFWYNNELIDLSTDGTSHNSHQSWQSARHHVIGFNLIRGKQIFIEPGISLDLFIGAGFRFDLAHVTLFQQYSGANGLQTFNPPRVYSNLYIQPALQLGMKLGFFY